MKRITPYLATGLLLSCLPGLLAASQTPGNGVTAPRQSAVSREAEKIHVNADHMRMNTNTGSSVYTGNVRITQGQRVLTGDTVTILQKNDQLQQIIVEGHPARFTDTPPDQPAIHASSRKMVYRERQNRLILTGDARLKQPEHLVSSDKIVYNTLSGTVTAGRTGKATDEGAVDEKDRVNITITPAP